LAEAGGPQSLETWKEVLKYKIDEDLANNNEAVVRLIKKGVKR
jgi:hypothetical protein